MRRSLVLLAIVLGAWAQDVAMPIGWFRSTRPATGATGSLQGGPIGSAAPSAPSGGLIGEIGKGGGDLLDSNRAINDFDRFSSSNKDNQNRNDFRGQYAVKLFGEALIPEIEIEVENAEAEETEIEFENLFVSGVGLLCVDNFGTCSAEFIVNAGGLFKFVVQTTECNVRVGDAGQGYIDARFKVVKGEEEKCRDVFPRRFVATFVAASVDELYFEVNGCHNGYEKYNSVASSNYGWSRGGSRMGRCKVVNGISPNSYLDEMVPISLIGVATRQKAGFGKLSKPTSGGFMGNDGYNSAGLGGYKDDESEKCKAFPAFKLGLSIVPEYNN